MRFLIFGAGAIGTYIGGSLAHAGQQVVFLERPEVAQELMKRGLRLNLGERSIQIPAPSVAESLEHALEKGPFDATIFALKSFDTRPALESFKAYLQDFPPILCLQNGVENEVVLETALGAGRVIAGTVTSAIGRQATGDIILERQRGIGVAGGHALSDALVRIFNEAGLNTRLYSHPAGMKWSKMLTNLVGNATCAILNMPPAQVFAHPGLYRMEIAQLREILAVMSAQKIPVVDLPATPVRLLAFAVQYLPAGISQPLLRRAVGGGRGGKMPSLHIDLHSGRGQSEVDYLNGAVVRYGEKYNIPTPVNRMLAEVLLELTSGQRPLESMSHQPDKLLGFWKTN